jgi:23S rRNA (cytidine2498-2'-O)-methyltransferase
LIDELGRVFPASKHRIRAPGWVESHLSPDDDRRREPSVAFAAQCLPSPSPLGAPSVSAWATLAGTVILEALREHAGPWRLHVFCVDYPGGPVGSERCRLIEASILKLLKDRLRRLARSRVVDPATPWSPDEVLVQLALETSSRGWLSVTPPEQRHALRRSLSRFPGGLVEVPDDPRAPSKAFRKLVEAQLRLGRSIAPDERCVDLGGSPGGWSFVALERGAVVTAVDRSPLREDLMAHPRLTFVRGDAFRFEPEAPVDWLLCDVIAFPERTLELIERWIERRLCRFFCVTVKFRGEDDYPVLERYKAMLRRSGAEFCIRQLTANRNEVTVLGEVGPARG